MRARVLLRLIIRCSLSSHSADFSFWCFRCALACGSQRVILGVSPRVFVARSARMASGGASGKVVQVYNRRSKKGARQSLTAASSDGEASRALERGGDWSCLPRRFLEQVFSKLDKSDVASARETCRTWRQGGDADRASLCWTDSIDTVLLHLHHSMSQWVEADVEVIAEWLVREGLMKSESAPSRVTGKC